MRNLNRNFLLISCFFSFACIIFSDESIGMYEDDKHGEVFVVKRSEEKRKDSKNFAEFLLEKLSTTEGSPLKNDKVPYVDVNYREDRVWINVQGKRVLLESK